MEVIEQEFEGILEKQKNLGIQVLPSTRSKHMQCNLTVAVQHRAVFPMRVPTV